MPKTIFYSWQSDLSARETRNLIRDALTSAIERVAASFKEAERPEIDHDTKGMAGSPEIVSTILAKIDAATVFVADVTPIAVSESGKHVPNPNVAIELGYAKKSLTPERIVTVWNTAVAESKPTDLPFDMRHRRGPISFHLPVGASRSDLREIRRTLTNQLADAIEACLSLKKHRGAEGLPWHPADDNYPSIWADGDQAFVVNTGFEGSKRYVIEPAPRMFMRLLPEKWESASDALRIFEQQGKTLTPLGRASSLSWGPTRGGFISYRISDPIERRGSLPTATRWFRNTGEMWGVASSAFAAGDDSRMYFSFGYAAERWLSWLEHNLSVCISLGGGGPFNVIAGVDGIETTFWPLRSWGGLEAVEALESQAVHKFVVDGPSDQAIIDNVFATFNLTRSAYGLPNVSRQDFEQSARI